MSNAAFVSSFDLRISFEDSSFVIRALIRPFRLYVPSPAILIAIASASSLSFTRCSNCAS